MQEEGLHWPKKSPTSFSSSFNGTRVPGMLELIYPDEGVLDLLGSRNPEP